jgi:hypothetical protein
VMAAASTALPSAISGESQKVDASAVAETDADDVVQEAVGCKWKPGCKTCSS